MNKLLFKADNVLKRKQFEIGHEVKANYFKPITNENISAFIPYN